MTQYLTNYFISTREMSRAAADMAAHVLVVLMVLVIAFTIYYLTRSYLLRLIHHLIRKSSNKWDDAFVEAGVFRSVLLLVPILILCVGFDRLIVPDGVLALAKRLTFAAMIFIAARALCAFLNACETIYLRIDMTVRRPIRGYIQGAKILIFFFAFIFMISTVLNKSPWGLLSVLGGLTAIFLLVFKDTILGFVASVQLSGYDMVRVGDWIQMDKYGADGDVIDVTVNTVKVRNWDKTITTIPTYALISDSFKNWRGMKDSGGRRIKRSICIDMNTITFCTDEMIDRFSRMSILQDYIKTRQDDINSYNMDRKIDLSSTVVNGRRQTNIGVFRAYVVAYLKNHPKIHKDMTFLVRHKQPTPQGLPLEIYVFSNDQVWANYESIQADIFDHLLAAIREFDLRVFQEPAGTDFARMLGSGMA